MSKPQTIISLDPIEQNKKLSFIGKILITRYSFGKSIKKMDPFGHYMFTGEQGSGKTASSLWFVEKLVRKYKKKKKNIVLYSNFGIGREVKKSTLYDTIYNFEVFDDEKLNNTIRIVILDEIQTYFPKDSIDKNTRNEIDRLISIFSQLRKRNTYIISTSQVYGRVNKSLREQCLFMINCSVSLSNRLVNEFIPSKAILCDELGRWSGKPKVIYKHGLSKLKYNTRKIIRE